MLRVRIDTELAVPDLVNATDTQTFMGQVIEICQPFVPRRQHERGLSAPAPWATKCACTSAPTLAPPTRVYRRYAGPCCIAQQQWETVRGQHGTNLPWACSDHGIRLAIPGISDRIGNPATMDLPQPMGLRRQTEAHAQQGAILRHQGWLVPHVIGQIQAGKGAGTDTSAARHTQGPYLRRGGSTRFNPL